VTLPAVLKRETIEQLGGLPRFALPPGRTQWGLEGSRLIDALTVLAINTVALQSFEEAEEEEEEEERGAQQRAVL
jgi:hypothetical protein